MNKLKIDKIVKVGVLAALSIVLVSLIHFPIFPAVSFIEYDMADVPILIGALAYGPWWGLALTVITAVIQGVTVSAGSTYWGIIMHILSTGSGVVAASLVYNRDKTKAGAVKGLVAYGFVILVMMLLCNYFITPLYLMMLYPTTYKAGQQTVLSLFGWIVAMNLIKPIINGIIVYLLYKPMSRYFLKKDFRASHLEAKERREQKKQDKDA